MMLLSSKSVKSGPKRVVGVTIGTIDSFLVVDCPILVTIVGPFSSECRGNVAGT